MTPLLRGNGLVGLLLVVILVIYYFLLRSPSIRRNGVPLRYVVTRQTMQCLVSRVDL